MANMAVRDGDMDADQHVQQISIKMLLDNW